MNRIALLTLWTFSAAVAEDITLTDGTILRQAKVLKQEAATLKIEHKDGISNVGPGLLPYAVSRRYTWDSQALESAKQAAEAAKAAGDAREASRQFAAAEDKAEKARIQALRDEWTAERKADGVKVGALNAWLQHSFPAMIERRSLRSGHVYSVRIENTGDKTFRGIVRGAVYWGSWGDDPMESKLVIEPGKTAKFMVESLFSCGDKTWVVMEIESNGVVVSRKLRAPKSVSSVEGP